MINTIIQVTKKDLKQVGNYSQNTKNLSWYRFANKINGILQIMCSLNVLDFFTRFDCIFWCSVFE